MKELEKELSGSDSCDPEELKEAAASLRRLATMLAARHIEDGMLRMKFNREVVYFTKWVIKSAEKKDISTEAALSTIKKEKISLYEQSFDHFKRNIGLIASYFQMTLGLALCGKASKMLCAAGSTLVVSHGVNNAKENTQNILQNRLDAEGPVRIAYQQAFIAVGGNKHQGNIAYGVVDIGISGYGIFRKVPDPKAWRLWHYMNKDLIRAGRAASRTSLLVDGFGTTATTHSIYEEMIKAHE